MTPKQRLAEFVGRMRDDITASKLLDTLDLFTRVESSLSDRDQEGTDHDEFFDELEALCREDVRSSEKVQRLRGMLPDTPPPAVEQVRLLLDVAEDGITFERILHEIDVLRRSWEPPTKTRRQMAAELGLGIEDVDDHLPDDDEKLPAPLAGSSPKRSQGNPTVHRNGGAGSGRGRKGGSRSPKVGRKPSAVSRKRNAD